MIRVIVQTPIPDEEIPQQTVSINEVLYDGQNRQALYYQSLPIPSSIDPANILQIFDSENPNE